MKQVPFYNIQLGGFWKKRIDINRESTIPAVYDRFDETGRVGAFACQWKEGMENRPHIFWDSDVAKWIEGAAYSMMQTPDKELEDKIEAIIDNIEKNQWEDGYINSYFTTCEPEKRFTNRDWHELYCAGHLVEAAVAYYEATGKDRFLKLVCKYMDCIEKTFITEKTAAFTTPGHEEIELALIKLYNCTKNNKYLEMCRFFIEERGRHENDLHCRDWCDERYDQTDKPVRELPEAFGHSVRAMYLYSGMADLARETNDKSLFDACERMFESAAGKRMYITGGIGSTFKGEAFAEDYTLPNDMAYAETCASIGLAFFASRMSLYQPDSKYDDVAELAAYNCALAGVSLDGKSFFYENPLEINVEKHRIEKEYYDSSAHLLTQRIEVFGCSCCPPNVVRFIPSIGNMFYSYDDNTVYVHHFGEGTAEFNGVKITQETRYPNHGTVRITVSGLKNKKLAVRVPGWSTYTSLNGEKLTAPLTRGYVYLDVTEEGQVFDFYFEMKPQFICANPKLEYDAGKVCICRGPLVYCAESVLNNNIRLSPVSLDLNAPIGSEFNEETGCYDLFAGAYVDKPTDKLYSIYDPNAVDKIELRMLPYFAFANNGESDMQIWFRTK